MRLLTIFIALGFGLAGCANGSVNSTGSGVGGNDSGGAPATGGNGGAVAGNGGGAQGGGAGGAAGVGGAGGGAGVGGGAPCQNLPDGAACYACCGNVFNAGQQIFETSFPSCACGPNTCYLDCNSSICGAANAVDSTCVGCIEDEIASNGACGMDPTFQNACLGMADCSSFSSCLSDCTP